MYVGAPACTCALQTVLLHAAADRVTDGVAAGAGRLLPKRDPIALLAEYPHVALSVVSNRRLSLW